MLTTCTNSVTIFSYPMFLNKPERLFFSDFPFEIRLWKCFALTFCAIVSKRSLLTRLAIVFSLVNNCVVWPHHQLCSLNCSAIHQFWKSCSLNWAVASFNELLATKLGFTSPRLSLWCHNIWLSEHLIVLRNFQDVCVLPLCSFFGLARINQTKSCLIPC